MRTLRFIVRGQSATRDPKCDFDNLVPGSDGYLDLEVAFDKTWDKCVSIVAGFFDSLGHEYTPQIISNGRCKIPADVLKNRVVKVQFYGRCEGKTIVTNKVEFHQDGGK